MTHVHHKNNYSTNLASNANAGDTTSYLSDAPAIDAPFWLIYDATNINGNYEEVYVLTVSTVTVTHAALAHGHTSAETVILSLGADEMSATQTALAAAQASVSAAQPVGEILMFPAASVPSGYLECDGSAVSRTTYATLYGVIGTLFGVGDGSTTFNLPDLGGSAAIGYKSADSDFNAVGKTGGAKTANLQHTHTVDAHTHAISGTTGNTAANHGSGSGKTVAAGVHNHPFGPFTSSAASANTMDNQGSTTQSIMNPYVTVKFIIKY